MRDIDHTVTHEKEHRELIQSLVGTTQTFRVTADAASIVEEYLAVFTVPVPVTEGETYTIKTLWTAQEVSALSSFEAKLYGIFRWLDSDGEAIGADVYDPNLGLMGPTGMFTSNPVDAPEGAVSVSIGVATGWGFVTIGDYIEFRDVLLFQQLGALTVVEQFKTLDRWDPDAAGTVGIITGPDNS